jgi:hypothetical protein
LENPQWEWVRKRISRSDSIAELMEMENNIVLAETAFKNKDYQLVVRLLEPFSHMLPDVPRTRLRLAKKYAAPQPGK